MHVYIQIKHFIRRQQVGRIFYHFQGPAERGWRHIFVGAYLCWCISLLVHIFVDAYLCWCISLLAHIFVGAYLCWSISLLMHIFVGAYLCWCISLLVHTFVGAYIPDCPALLEVESYPLPCHEDMQGVVEVNSTHSWLEAHGKIYAPAREPFQTGGISPLILRLGIR